jgi:hypothetical protein
MASKKIEKMIHVTLSYRASDMVPSEVIAGKGELASFKWLNVKMSAKPEIHVEGFSASADIVAAPDSRKKNAFTLRQVLERSEPKPKAEKKAPKVYAELDDSLFD